MLGVDFDVKRVFDVNSDKFCSATVNKISFKDR